MRNAIIRNGHAITFGVGERVCPPGQCEPDQCELDPPLIGTGLACWPREWKPVGVDSIGVGFHFNVGNLIKDVGKVASGAVKDVGKVASGAVKDVGKAAVATGKFAGKAASSAVRIAGESVTDPKKFVHDVAHIASDVVKIQKFVLEEAQGVISLIPGVGTAISAAISAGLAVLEGGGPLIIAIKTAYGAIPIPVGIRSFTDIVLDATLVLVKKGTDIKDDILLVTRTEIGKQLPEGAIRNVGLHVFDTLAHLILGKLHGKPTQGKVTAPLSKEQRTAVQSGQPLPAAVTPIPPTVAAYKPLAEAEVAQSTEVTLALPTAGAAAGYGPYPQAAGAAPTPAGSTAGVGRGGGGGHGGGGHGGGGWHGGGGGWHGGGRHAFRSRGRGYGWGGGYGWGWGSPWWPYVVMAPDEVECAAWGPPIDLPTASLPAMRATLANFGDANGRAVVRGADGNIYLLISDRSRTGVMLRPCAAIGIGDADTDVLRMMALDLLGSIRRTGAPQYAARPVKSFAQAWNAASADTQIATDGKYTREIEGALTAALNALAPGSGAVPAAVL